MKIDPQRGRILVIREPIGIVRTIGSLLLLCSAVTFCRALFMVARHEPAAGFSNPSFWFLMTIATVVLGIALSAPARWRWTLDRDTRTVSSQQLRFNLPTDLGESFSLDNISCAETVRSPNGYHQLVAVEQNGNKIVIQGIKSRRNGWPNNEATRLNKFLAEIKVLSREKVDLNDPSVTLREVGIVAPSDPMIVGLALEQFSKLLSPKVRELCDKPATAVVVTKAIISRFYGGRQAATGVISLNEFTNLQLVLLFDTCVNALTKMTHAQYASIATSLDRPDQRPLSAGIHSYAIYTRFLRYVSRNFRRFPAEPPANADLQSVLNECLTVIATVATFAYTVEPTPLPRKGVFGRRVEFSSSAPSKSPSSTMILKAYHDGVAELSSELQCEWSAAAKTIEELNGALQAIERAAPAPMRNVLMRACIKSAESSGILDHRMWLLLRSISDGLIVTLPPLVPEPTAEVRMKVAK